MPLNQVPRRHIFSALFIIIFILVSTALLRHQAPNTFVPAYRRPKQCPGQEPDHSESCGELNRLSPEYDPSPILSLPLEYTHQRLDQAFCNERFGTQYLQRLSNRSTSYCTEESNSFLSCFHSRTAKEGRTDSFCVGEGSSLQDGHFELGCNLRELSGEEITNNVPQISSLSTYWYNTGPGVILRDYIKLNAQGKPPAEKTQPYTVLVSREGHSNPWHSLMEILSLSMTLDVLRMAPNPRSHRPFLESGVQPRLLILDSHPKGPFWDLWSLFAPGGVFQKENMRKVAPSDNIIVPLPGGSNPFWQGDWEAHACSVSPLLNVFSDRILDFYNISRDPVIDDRPLVFTFVDRLEKRRLINKKKYIEALRQQFPSVKIQTIDFAALPFEEQVRIASETDILAGVHGAGLTHSMFQKPGSALVEIIPRNFNFKGFRNLAKLRGHQYFSAHASEEIKQPPVEKRNWQNDDLDIEEDRFLQLMEIAIKSMYNRGQRQEDVV